LTTGTSGNGLDSPSWIKEKRNPPSPKKDEKNHYLPWENWYDSAATASLTPRGVSQA
tara:strand:+ start:80 stop:250 length:171 start_codon:yes stop_codon:yes gene_type:complete